MLDFQHLQDASGVSHDDISVQEIHKFPKTTRRKSPTSNPAFFKKPHAVFSVCKSWASSLWLATMLFHSGDVGQNPGPQKKQLFICTICNDILTTKQYSFLCNLQFNHEHWVHKKCTNTEVQKTNTLLPYIYVYIQLIFQKLFLYITNFVSFKLVHPSDIIHIILNFTLISFVK